MAPTISGRFAFLFISVCFLAQCALAEEKSGSDRIAGGIATSVAQHPYITYIFYDQDQKCAGTLITNRHVVTACHCLDGVKAIDIIVYGGATFISSGGVASFVLLIIKPAAYNPTTLNMDVAVLKLATPMTGPNIAPINMFEGSWQAGAMTTLVGWGQTGAGGVFADRLRSAQVPVISKNECVNKYAGIMQLTDTMFCTYSPVRGSCTGDDGGPVVYQNRLAGVVSDGIGCGQGYPDVHTSIKKAMPFINNALTY